MFASGAWFGFAGADFGASLTAAAFTAVAEGAGAGTGSKA